jgi:hypothetical protein
MALSLIRDAQITSVLSNTELKALKEIQEAFGKKHIHELVEAYRPSPQVILHLQCMMPLWVNCG